MLRRRALPFILRVAFHPALLNLYRAIFWIFSPEKNTINNEEGMEKKKVMFISQNKKQSKQNETKITITKRKQYKQIQQQ